MKHFLRLTIMSLLLLVVASFALAGPVFAFDDCSNGPAISASVDDGGDALIVYAKADQVQTDQRTTAQGDLTRMVSAVICPVNLSPVPRARDVIDFALDEAYQKTDQKLAAELEITLSDV